MKSLSLLITSLFLAVCCGAQDPDYVPSTRIFFEPIALIDFASSSQPSLRVGIDIPLSQKVSLITTGGLYRGGYYVKSGIKKYVLPLGIRMGFLELSCFYKNESHEVTDNIRVFEPGAGHPSEGASFAYNTSRVVYGINLEIGKTMTFEYLCLEWFAGAGLRHRNVSVSISDSMQDQLYHHHESIIDAVTNAPANNQIALSISAGIRLGYVFRCRQKFKTGFRYRPY